MKSKYVYIVLGFAVLIGILVWSRESGLLSEFQGEELKNTVLGFGVWAPVVYIAFYAAASLLFIPGSPITLVGGALFGPLYGTLYTILGATVGAVLAFQLARALGHKFVHSGTGKVSQKLHAYDDKIAKNGFLTVLILRLVPLFPFNALNFALGLTRVSFRDYLLGTFLGIIPGTFAYVYFGDSLATLSPLRIGGALALVIVLSLLGRYALARYDGRNTNSV